VLALGSGFPGDCLRLLADLHPDSINHALQVGLQPVRLLRQLVPGRRGDRLR
jgi:hypothetical protein